MKIEKDKWVAIHYTLTDEDGKQIDSSVGAQPLGYIHGNGYLIPGLEAQLEGKEPGDKFTAVVQPKDGYGEFDPRMVMDVEREKFEGIDVIEIGQQFQVMTQGGPAIVRVVEVGDKTVKIDGNHELAGKVLTFDVEVVEVREPTEEELNPSCGCGGGCGGCGGGCGDDCSGCGDGGCGDGGCGGCGN